MLGSVNSIESFSTVDGPGIRTTIFLNGCNKRCIYCHNPEMWNKLPDNIDAITLANKIIRNKEYFNNNGGVTFSGGEPLFQSKFLIDVCKLLKKENINIAIDTAGYIDEYVIELLNYIDIIIFDIKDITEYNYLKITNSKIEDSIKFIKLINSLNKKIIIRQVIVPGYHDNKEFIIDLKKYINKYFNQNNILSIEFIPYHQLGKEKYIKLGIEYNLNCQEMDILECNKLYELYKSI